MRKQFKFTLSALLVILIAAFSGCQESPDPKIPDVDQLSTITEAKAVLHPTEGHQAKGVVIFTQTGEGMQIVADVEGLSPGRHGFHIHEYGDCSAPDASSAGGHFNPSNKPHGGPEAEEKHIGDLGNITVDENGLGHLLIIDPDITFSGLNSIIGRAVVIHAGEDDLTSQPSGNAGARAACGVIGISKPEVPAGDVQ